MSPFRPTALRAAWWLLCLAAWPALAQTPNPPARSASAAEKPAARHPGDATAPVPPLRHRSAFTGYRPLGEVAPTAWREANDTVTRIGGWRTYTREAHAPEPAASAASAASATSSAPAASASAAPAAAAAPARPASAGAGPHHHHHHAPAGAGAAK